ncbi:hypothetical protein H0H93_000663 [Arthromyces matolae]|nr:hypothetical protein H0H93_000663 [Arthromyces matolae]
MEDLISRPSWNKMSQVDDPKLRMATRPKGASTTKQVESRRTGMAAEDFGSSFTVKKPKGSKTPSRKNQETLLDSDLDSSDELDTIASSRASSRAGSVVAQEKGSKNNGFIDKEGTYHEYHPAYSQSTNVLKKLKFNKIKPSQGDADHQPLDASSSKPTNLSDTMDRHTTSIFRPAPLPDPAVARTRREPSLERRREFGDGFLILQKLQK